MCTSSVKRCTCALMIVGFLAVMPSAVKAQSSCIRIMDQDSTLNNLVDPPGQKTVPLGTLGKVERAGVGKRTMILIPGAGFGGDSFKEFKEAYAADYSMIAVTLPGFGGTTPLASSPESASFGEQLWTKSAVDAVGKLMESEGIKDAVILGHWMTGTQVAIRLARKYPDRIAGLILVAGTAAMFMTDTVTYPPAKMTSAWRVKAIDQYMAPKWFKTVTRETWDDNNFMPHDYAVNPILGLRLWRQAYSPQLHVWARYLCEFNAQDVNDLMDSLTTPTLLMRPGFENNYADSGSNYMEAFCHRSWKPATLAKPNLKSVTVPNSRVFIWLDQPEAFKKELDSFVDALPERSAKLGSN